MMLFPRNSLLTHYCVVAGAAVLAGISVSVGAVGFQYYNDCRLLDAVWEEKVNYRAVDTLLARGARADVADDRGRTALIWAVAKRDVRLVRLLIAKGATVNQRDSHGRTALTWAGYTHDSAVTNLLLKAGASY